MHMCKIYLFNFWLFKIFTSLCSLLFTSVICILPQFYAIVSYLSAHDLQQTSVTPYIFSNADMSIKYVHWFFILKSAISKLA